MLLLSLGALLACAGETSLRQDAYVWQRAWNDPLRAALAEHGGSFSNLVVLNAEVSWKFQTPTTTLVPVDYTLLADTRAHTGLALRIGTYSGRFSDSNSPSRFLAALAVSLLASARSNGVTPVEFQVDYDCASATLGEYVYLAKAIRHAIAPVPLFVTTLPAWLGQPALKDLLKETDGFVLQVHSLQRPKDAASHFDLCDTNQAARWVAQASRLNTPFRVALPTYSYVLAFAPSGRFIGLSAEGPQKAWPANTQIREVKTDPAAMAGLIQNWLERRPPLMKGVIWYRFPISTDAQNLPWASLEAVMNGRAPRTDCHAAISQRDNLSEVSLVNSGEAEFRSSAVVRIDWDKNPLSRPDSFDALADFKAVDQPPASLIFTSQKKQISIAPGRHQIIGWIRFRKPIAVRASLTTD
jgi:hypothetical protein